MKRLVKEINLVAVCRMRGSGETRGGEGLGLGLSLLPGLGWQ